MSYVKRLFKLARCLLQTVRSQLVRNKKATDPRNIDEAVYKIRPNNIYNRDSGIETADRSVNGYDQTAQQPIGSYLKTCYHCPLIVRLMVSRDNFYLTTQTTSSNDFDTFTISEAWPNRSTSDTDMHIPPRNA